MEQTVEPAAVHLTCLIQRQAAWSDLQEVADAIAHWSEIAGEFRPEPSSRIEPADTDRPEFIEAQARLFDPSFRFEAFKTLENHPGGTCSGDWWRPWRSA